LVITRLLPEMFVLRKKRLGNLLKRRRKNDPSPSLSPR